MPTTDTKKDSRQLNPKIVMLLLLIVFVGPMLFAWKMVRSAEGMEFNTVNHGDLVKPVVDVDQLMLVDPLKQEPVNTDLLKNQWSLIYLLPKLCSEGCHQAIFLTRQIHVLLNKDSDRLQRVLMFLPNQRNEALHKMLADTYPEAKQVIISQESFDTYLHSLTDPVEQAEVGSFYLVDPLGNLMMTYPGDIQHKGILKDLKKLLKISKIG